MMMMPVPGMGMNKQQGPKKPGEAFEREWENIEVTRHEWALDNEAEAGLSMNSLSTVEIGLLKKWNQQS